MAYLIIDMTTKSIARKKCADLRYDTQRGAKIACTSMNKKEAATPARYIVMPTYLFEAYYNPIVTVYNCLSGQPVQLKRSEVGGPCDPSTERYHQM